MHFRSEVGSNRPTAAMPWMNEIEKGKMVEDLSKSYSITGATRGDFQTLDLNNRQWLDKHPSRAEKRKKNNCPVS